MPLLPIWVEQGAESWRACVALDARTQTLDIEATVPPSEDPSALCHRLAWDVAKRARAMVLWDAQDRVCRLRAILGRRPSVQHAAGLELS